ncbi:hypothetical protein N3K66_003705 [Trichothecium roseum]|uniref:Uncharacterized protein n=1 Tax=Trichothecium roseum TaxID=47278 RepID=A0ACC0V6Q6_9HYPO|nr:hypothetical protein N3K66_003705 [Trichothecium roseum]
MDHISNIMAAVNNNNNNNITMTMTMTAAIDVLLSPRGGEDATPESPMIIAAPVPPPYTTPSLTANLALRVALALLTTLLTLVPLRQLWRHGELPAALFVLNAQLKNLAAAGMALAWPTDDVLRWPSGRGLCDAHPFLNNFSTGLYLTCLLAVVRNLAHQVGLLRANPLTAGERRKRNVVQALIVFPLPVAQVACTWSLTAQRYAVGTLIGCTWVGYGAWPYVVFFIVAPLVVALLTAGYAVFTYFRFRDLTKETSAALSRNRTVSARAHRTKRRLYLMVVSILVPFLPVVVALTVLNILDIGYVRPLPYPSAAHDGVGVDLPFPWNSVVYLTSDKIPFALMNNAYICMFTAVPVFWFFGLTRDAVNDYRLVLLALGLGRWFPRLREEYDPDRSSATASSSSGGATSSFGSSLRSTGSRSSNLKFQSVTSSQELQSFSARSEPLGIPAQQQYQRLPPTATTTLQTTNTAAEEHGDAVPADATATNTTRPEMRRNSLLLRTTLNFPIPFPIKLPSLFPRSRSSGKQASSVSSRPAQGQQPSPRQSPRSPLWGLSTRVWSKGNNGNNDDDEARLVSRDNNSTSVASGAKGHGDGNDDGNDIAPQHAQSSAQDPAASAAGVHVQISLTRETHPAGQQKLQKQR